jgi:hypothetical protein
LCKGGYFSLSTFHFLGAFFAGSPRALTVKTNAKITREKSDASRKNITLA